MEECPNKSLYLKLFDKDNIKPETGREWTKQITKGIEKLQELGIAHRFMKLQHILFNKEDNVKIAGFSKSVMFKENNKSMFQKKERRSRKNCYLPPEAFRGNYDPSKIDMWSLGVIMVAMHTQRYPFNVKSTAKFSAMWRQFVVLHKMNIYLRAACNKVFFIDPKRRATPGDFLSHKYFSATIEKITPKTVKTSVDPKYDSKLSVEPSMQISTANCSSASSFSNSQCASSKSKSASTAASGSCMSGSKAR